MKLGRKLFKQSSKLRIEINPQPQWDGKWWVEVTFLKSRKWIPSDSELGALIRAIGWCEDKKYPNGRGRLMLLDFLQEHLWAETTEEELQNKYQIPIRGNNHVPT